MSKYSYAQLKNLLHWVHLSCDMSRSTTHKAPHGCPPRPTARHEEPRSTYLLHQNPHSTTEVNIVTTSATN